MFHNTEVSCEVCSLYKARTQSQHPILSSWEAAELEELSNS